ncbi:hypothetical protein ACFFSY_25345 [Paenibacillus aurantiacus]|uniref:Phage tail protein n=1 Tax=Paenibacillus aurantiacus TaxID=1936118 RepID=A0ABV5KXE6_9BACL
MSKLYYLKHKDVTIGLIKVDESSISYERINGIEHEIGDLAFPLGLYPIAVVNGFTVPARDHIPTDKDIRKWLRGRIFPRERGNARTIMTNLAVRTYNPWEIIAKTRVVSLNDYYWLAVNENEEYSDVHPRYRLEKNRHYKARKSTTRKKLEAIAYSNKGKTKIIITYTIDNKNAEASTRHHKLFKKHNLHLSSPSGKVKV